ncbi:type II toxin-antitoxin system HicB family antitoxin [Streptomyces rhizosphaerihabitans]|uniref:type II toxin-antitoxin system HicB family antitoxin n=1 Tax=Streptomyces rhizosphaerihabitans TaxID=1266770 RepID=UPI0021BF8346|nr:type II toxin-antitoxin system HicB family antitoxin [Streptomyces rhizosphaerihabitans]MCT9007417.1 type II toxin-antitoxin system HicB family antitoxin [Streptomyces rhizosphaerihabitans]
MLKFTLRIPKELHARLTAQAAADRRPLNAEILHLPEIALHPVRATTNRPDGDSSTPAPLRRGSHSPPARRPGHPARKRGGCFGPGAQYDVGSDRGPGATTSSGASAWGWSDVSRQQ